MTIDEFLSRVMPCSIKLGDDHHPAEIVDRAGHNLTIGDGSIDALLAIIKDAWSRHPREGERRCGTCRFFDADTCCGPRPAEVFVTAESTKAHFGTTCPVWQREEKP